MTENQAEDKNTTKKKFNIIYVDDSKIMVDVVVRIMRSKNVECLGFDNPLEALAYIKDNKPSVLVTDFEMPGMTGVGLIKGARKTHKDLKAIIYSGSKKPTGVPKDCQWVDKTNSIDSIISMAMHL